MDTQVIQAVPVRLLRNPIHLLTLGFGSGLSPKMPGTFGTLTGVILYLLFMPTSNWLIYSIIVAFCFFTGISMCSYTAKALNVHDHPAIVWDEIVGFWLVMLLVPKTWVWILVGFVLFRFFDILKPWPIKMIDNKVKGGLGIMLDDAIAALFSLIIIQIIIYLL
ncbi:MAG: phosphatidylglycerophosphatase A [Pseudomonadota bacterium]